MVPLRCSFGVQVAALEPRWGSFADSAAGQLGPAPLRCWDEFEASPAVLQAGTESQAVAQVAVHCAMSGVPAFGHRCAALLTAPAIGGPRASEGSVSVF